MRRRMVHKYLHALILDNGKTSTAGVLSVCFVVALQPALVASLYQQPPALTMLLFLYLREGGKKKKACIFLNCSVAPVLLSTICFGA